MDKKLKAFERLLKTMEELREKCPWDRKQTNQSLRPYTIEETYELTGALLEEAPEKIKEELGDLLLHIVFYSRIASEKNQFDIGGVCNKIADKLVKRHPHIYGDVKVKDDSEVKKNWEQLKLKEKKNKSILEGLPRSLPSLVKAVRLQEKARDAGFDWKEKEGVWEKVREEIREFKELTEQQSPPPDELEEEYGDLLFSLVNLGRFIHVNPENALEKTNLKFIRRFNHIEQQVKKKKKDMRSLPLEELEKHWQEAKHNENKGSNNGD